MTTVLPKGSVSDVLPCIAEWSKQLKIRGDMKEARLRT